MRIVILGTLAKQAWIKVDDLVDIGFDIEANLMRFQVSVDGEKSCSRVRQYRKGSDNKLSFGTSARDEWGGMRHAKTSIAGAECEIHAIERGAVTVRLPDSWKAVFAKQAEQVIL